MPTNLIYEPQGRAREYAALACNVYRGCDHACVYCLTSDTTILRADMSTSALSDIQVGDVLLGVSELGTGRANKNKFVASTVLHKWTTYKPVYRITLANGMTARCSGDHRWLTDRGWKFVTGSINGDNQRPYLTTNNVIRTVTSSVATPAITDDYRRGYLSGIIRGDGHLAEHVGVDRLCVHTERATPGKPYLRSNVQYHFRLALKDAEPIERATTYLSNFGINVSTFQFTDTMTGIRNHSKTAFDAIGELIAWSDSPEYMRGFLAGIYDAEGSFEKSGPIRIVNNDHEILTHIEMALSHFGLSFVYDVPHVGPNAIVHTIRITGGRDQCVRFWQLTDPAMTRKRSLIGGSLKNSSAIVSIEDLGYSEVMYDIETTSGTFIANGMVSHNCYAPSATQRARADFVISQTRGPDFLPSLEKEAAKLEHSEHAGKQVLLSFTCDPFSALDVTAKVTRSAIQILHRHGFAVCTLTKGGHRALRDLDLFRAGDAFATTMTLLDDAASLEWEPGAALPSERIDTLQRFHAAGVTTWVSLEPVIDPTVALEIIRQTHRFVDLYKVGKMNYHPIAKEIDWHGFALDATSLLDTLGKRYYVKDDLAAFLPGGKASRAISRAELETRLAPVPTQLSMF